MPALCRTFVVAAAILLAGACGRLTPVGHEQPVTSQAELRNSMRQLWVEHVVWTRVYLISAIAGLPDKDEAATRLLKNQVDLGGAIKTFYGTEAGDTLASLLTDNVTIATQWVVAAQAQDTAAQDAALTLWHHNADQTAAFLANANSAFNPDHLKSMMNDHLDRTAAEATARLTRTWDGDARAYSAVLSQALELADELARGIGAQFPDKVSPMTRTISNEQLHLAMRALWEGHVCWTRFYLMSAIAGLDDTDTAAVRLLQNQVAIGTALKPYYGEAAGDALAELLHDHITIAVELVAAAKAGDSDEVAEARGRWTQNADAIATFLANANPAWSVTSLQQMMHTHLDQTLTEATARLTGHWNSDVAAYDTIELHVLDMADVISDGVATQFAEGLE